MLIIKKRICVLEMSSIISVQVIFDNTNPSTVIGPALQQLIQSNCIPVFGINMQFFTLNSSKVTTQCIQMALEKAGILSAIPDFNIPSRLNAVEHTLRYSQYFRKAEKVFTLFLKVNSEELKALAKVSDKLNVSLPNVCGMQCDMLSVLPDQNLGKEKGKGIVSRLQNAKEFGTNVAPQLISKLSPAISSAVGNQIKNSLSDFSPSSLFSKYSPKKQPVSQETLSL